MNEQPQPAGSSPVERPVRPVAWVRDLGPQPHCVTDLRYCAASDVERGVHLEYLPLYDKAALDAAMAEIDRLNTWAVAYYRETRKALLEERESIARWLDGQGQPGYAHEVRHGAGSLRECGEAGHAEGKCGNARCLRGA